LKFARSWRQRFNNSVRLCYPLSPPPIYIIGFYITCALPPSLYLSCPCSPPVCLYISIPSPSPSVGTYDASAWPLIAFCFFPSISLRAASLPWWHPHTRATVPINAFYNRRWSSFEVLASPHRRPCRRSPTKRIRAPSADARALSPLPSRMVKRPPPQSPKDPSPQLLAFDYAHALPAAPRRAPVSVRPLRSPPPRIYLSFPLLLFLSALRSTASSTTPVDPSTDLFTKMMTSGQGAWVCSREI
jgi:hypothetical protein